MRASNDLVELALKRPFSDGTYAVQLDPLSLLCRLVATVPPPKFHTVRYAGVLASASRLRSRIVPPRSTENTDADTKDAPPTPGGFGLADAPRQGLQVGTVVAILLASYDGSGCLRRGL